MTVMRNTAPSIVSISRRFHCAGSEIRERIGRFLDGRDKKMAVKPWDWKGRPDRDDRKRDKDDWRPKRCK